MAKVLKCRDLGVACDFAARGETDEEVLKQMRVHALDEHNIASSPALEAEWRKAIHSASPEEEIRANWPKIFEGEWRETFHEVP